MLSYRSIVGDAGKNVPENQSAHLETRRCCVAAAGCFFRTIFQQTGKKMNEKNRLVFVVLAAFLGFLGVHSYYTGNKIKALFQFLPGICGLLILILSCILSIYILLWPALILLLIPFAWAMYDVFTVGTDVYDVPMKEEHPALEFWLPILVDFVIPGLILLTVVIIKLIPAIWLSQENTERLNCADNLNTLGMAMQMFALDHSGRYPNLEKEKDFEKLAGYDKRISYFICQANQKQRYPFLWIGGYREPMSPKVPVAVERIGNHKGFVNILFADGSVKSLEYPHSTYLQLAMVLRDGITKDEFEMLKRKLKQFDNPQPAASAKKAPVSAKPAAKKKVPVKSAPAGRK